MIAHPDDHPRGNYRCVFIDWHGTLSHSLFWEHRDDLAPLRAALFAPDGSHSNLVVPWCRGALTSEEVIATVAATTGIDPAMALRELEASCRRMIIPAAALAAVAALRTRGTFVAIATDNMDAFGRWTVPSLGLARQFDAILNSAELRTSKWECDEAGRSRFFRPFLDRAGIGPGESILLDDSVEGEAHVAPFGIAYRRIAAPADLLSALAWLNER